MLFRSSLGVLVVGCVVCSWLSVMIIEIVALFSAVDAGSTWGKTVRIVFFCVNFCFVFLSILVSAVAASEMYSGGIAIYILLLLLCALVWFAVRLNLDLLHRNTVKKKEAEAVKQAVGARLRSRGVLRFNELGVAAQDSLLRMKMH